MGLKSVAVVASRFFGINLTYVWLTVAARVHVLKNCWISRHIAGPVISQFDWKNATENPYGPWALSGWMAKVASFISLQVGFAVNITFCFFSNAGTQGLLYNMHSIWRWRRDELVVVITEHFWDLLLFVTRQTIIILYNWHPVFCLSSFCRGVEVSHICISQR